MNGRIYDPLLGRFLSADVLVQFPANLQSYNRYSYVMNNPLSYTDPTGFELKKDADGFFRINPDNPGTSDYVNHTYSQEKQTTNNQRSDKQEPKETSTLQRLTDGAIKVQEGDRALNAFFDQGINYNGEPADDWRKKEEGLAETGAAAAKIGHEVANAVAKATNPAAAMLTADPLDLTEIVTVGSALKVADVVTTEGTVINSAIKVVIEVKKTVETVESTVDTAAQAAETALQAAQAAEAAARALEEKEKRRAQQ